MKRRSFFLATGAIATLSFAPHFARQVWNRVATDYLPAVGLDETQLVLVSAVADTVIPRTHSPGANDVDVPAWISIVVSEYFTISERAVFLHGLDEIDALALSTEGVPFAALSSLGRARIMAMLERRNLYERIVFWFEHSRMFAQLLVHMVELTPFNLALSAMAQRARTYIRLKELIIHAYFTSERIQKEVLHVEMMPGRFEGDAPMSVAHSELCA